MQVIKRATKEGAGCDVQDAEEEDWDGGDRKQTWATESEGQLKMGDESDTK